MNAGEEICGEWLKHIAGCDFVQYNVATRHVQGEIDVIGVNLAARKVYVCEVAIHLTTGLQYVKDNQPNNVAKLTEKFVKGIRYVRDSFPSGENGYDHEFMLWTPVVKRGKPGAKHSQIRDIQAIRSNLLGQEDVELVLIVNEAFQSALRDLRAVALKQTTVLQSSLMRYLQIETHLEKHLQKSGQGGIN